MISLRKEAKHAFRVIASIKDDDAVIGEDLKRFQICDVLLCNCALRG